MSIMDQKNLPAMLINTIGVKQNKSCVGFLRE